MNKFRFWNEHRKEMCSWEDAQYFHENLWDLLDTGYSYDETDEHKWVVMQYIGYKNFCEGDIVTGIKTHADKLFVIEKRRDSEFVGFIPVQVGKKENAMSFFLSYDDMKIIGNIYQNPELLPK